MNMAGGAPQEATAPRQLVVPEVANAAGTAAGLPDFRGMTQEDIAAMAQEHAVGNHAVANSFIWAQANLGLELRGYAQRQEALIEHVKAYCEGVHNLINLHSQTASRMEYSREQSQIETRNILNSILNATVAKNLRVEQDGQGTADSSGQWEAPKGKPCLLESIPTDIYKQLEQEWGVQANVNGLDLMETEQEEDQ